MIANNSRARFPLHVGRYAHICGPLILSPMVKGTEATILMGQGSAKEPLRSPLAPSSASPPQPPAKLFVNLISFCQF